MTDDTQGPDAIIARLSEDADQVITTSCAVIILKGDIAYKIKKPVDYGFLDFTSRAKRKAALARELQLNQRTASHIYQSVTEIDGESVLVMRRFDQASVLAEQGLGDVGWAPDLELMQDLGETIADFHAGSDICDDAGHIDNINYVIASNARNIGIFRERLNPVRVDKYDRMISAAYDSLQSAIFKRFDDGFVRRCHGDLHLGNIFVEGGRPVLFDCIEFNERLSQIDVLYDMGFLLMDLWVRGHEVAANRVMNAYLDRAARSGSDDALMYDGLKLLPLYLSVRAGVRCHVNAHNGDMDKASVYLEAAMAFLEPVAATLGAVGGLSGSGKTTHARAIALARGRPPGAVILRSDEIRKRLWQCPSFERLPPEAYTPEENQRTYDHVLAMACAALRAGQAVIVDATLRDSGQRSAIEALAQTQAVDFDGVWLDLPREDRVRRVSARRKDASDATGEVAASQADIAPESLNWTRISP